MRPIEKGSILYSPKQSQIWISMGDHPKDLGSFLVLGKINQGIKFLRQIRIQEHIQKISIAANKP